VVTAACPNKYQIIFAPEESLRLVPLRLCKKRIELRLRRRSSVTRRFTSERLSNLDPLPGNGFPGFEVLQYSDRSAVVTAVCPYKYQINFAPEESLRLVPLRLCKKSIEFWLCRRSSVTRRFTSERLSNLDPLTGNSFPGFEVLQYSDRSAVVTAVCPYKYQIIFAPEESLRLVPWRLCEKSIELGLRRRSSVNRKQ
jgi:hypothetical protein